ncbi:hypothetical protein HanPSC8_Chr04g0157761 [Helianthus annuus]|nr:hypothetical protein HanPSC8_Chr04g0157761 [Helianthus annuus]
MRSITLSYHLTKKKIYLSPFFLASAESIHYHPSFSFHCDQGIPLTYKGEGSHTRRLGASGARRTSLVCLYPLVFSCVSSLASKLVVVAQQIFWEIPF